MPKKLQNKKLFNNYKIIKFKNFFPAQHIGENLLEFLQNHLPQLLQDVPLNMRQNMWSLFDGAPPYFKRGHETFK